MMVAVIGLRTVLHGLIAGLVTAGDFGDVRRQGRSRAARRYDRIPSGSGQAVRMEAYQMPTPQKPGAKPGAKPSAPASKPGTKK